MTEKASFSARLPTKLITKIKSGATKSKMTIGEYMEKEVFGATKSDDILDKFNKFKEEQKNIKVELPDYKDTFEQFDGKLNTLQSEIVIIKKFVENYPIIENDPSKKSIDGILQTQLETTSFLKNQVDDLKKFSVVVSVIGFVGIAAMALIVLKI